MYFDSVCKRFTVNPCPVGSLRRVVHFQQWLWRASRFHRQNRPNQSWHWLRPIPMLNIKIGSLLISTNQILPFLYSWCVHLWPNTPMSSHFLAISKKISIFQTSRIEFRWILLNYFRFLCSRDFLSVTSTRYHIDNLIGWNFFDWKSFDLWKSKNIFVKLVIRLIGSWNMLLVKIGNGSHSIQIKKFKNQENSNQGTNVLVSI